MSGAMSEAPWEAYLASRFPGYLLPASRREALSEEEAARFLSRLGGDATQLERVRVASLAAAHAGAIEEFALRALPDWLARPPPPPGEVAPRAWEGSAPGRLDVMATLRLRLAGQSTRFVTRARGAGGERGEDAVLKAAARRLRAVLRALAAAALDRIGGWTAAAACEAALEGALGAPAFGAIADAPIGPAEEEAALGGPHPAYALGARLHRAARVAQDSRDPAAIARLVAEGALGPLAASTRFELAVLLRLVEAIEATGRFRLRRTAVLPDREEVAVFDAPAGARVRVFYNQACLPAGPHELGVRHYLGREGRLRPDVVAVIEAPGREARAVVVEAKHSEDAGYLVEGWGQALLYRQEYAPLLTGWPKVVLVSSGAIAGAVRRGDDVIAVGWEGWVGEGIAEGVLEGV